MRAYVQIQEIDTSTRVPSYPGVYGAIVMASKKGDVNSSTIVTSESSLLKQCTPDETIKVGYTNAYYSALAFLAKSNKLHVIRAANDPKYGGCVIGAATPLTTVNSVSNISTNSLTLKHLTDADAAKAQFVFDTCVTGEKFRVSVGTGDTLPEGLVVDTDYYLIKFDEDDFRVQLASSYANAVAGTAVVLDPDNDSPGSGEIILTLQKASTNSSITYAMTNPENFDLNSSNGKPSGMTSVFTADADTDKITVDATFYSWIKTGEKCQVSSTGTLPTGLVADTDYYIIKSTTENTIFLASSKANAEIAEHIDLTTAGTLTGVQAHTISYTENTELVGINRECLLIHGKDPGAWNNDIYISLLNYPPLPFSGNTADWTADEKYAANTVKEPDCFQIKVWKKDVDGNAQLLETHLCSRLKNKKDGYGRNCYVEDILESSYYIRAIDNLAVHESVRPLNQYDVSNQSPELLILAKGHDGGDVTAAHMVTALSTISSKRKATVSLLMDGGFAVPAYQLALLDLAETRKDCVAILTFPTEAELSSDYLNELLKYRNETLNANSSFGAIYTPSVKILDKYNNRYIWIAPDGYVGGAISETATNQEIWFAAAGNSRGVLNVLDTAIHFDEGEMDVLYDNEINPIDNYPGKGIRIWGNKTLLTTASALDRLNVRLMLTVIEPACADFLENFIFEINDSITRVLAASGLTSYMTGIQSRRGVYAFKVKCDEENNTAEDIDANIMNCWLFVQPTKTAEFIKFPVIITKTGGSFTYTA